MRKTMYLIETYESVNSKGHPLPVLLVHYDYSKIKAVKWMNNYFKILKSKPEYDNKFIGLVLHKVTRNSPRQVMRISFKDLTNKCKKRVFKK